MVKMTKLYVNKVEGDLLYASEKLLKVLFEIEEGKITLGYVNEVKNLKKAIGKYY